MPPGCAASTNTKSKSASSKGKNSVKPVQPSTATAMQNNEPQNDKVEKVEKLQSEKKEEVITNMHKEPEKETETTNMTKEPEKEPDPPTEEEIGAKKEEIMKSVEEAIEQWNSVEETYDEEKIVVDTIREAVVVIYKSYFTLKKMPGINVDIVAKFRREVLGKRLSESQVTFKISSLVIEIYKNGFKHEDGKLNLGRWNPLKNCILILLNFSDACEDVAKDAAMAEGFLETVKQIFLDSYDQHMSEEGLASPEERLLKWSFSLSHNTGMVDANVPRLRNLDFVSILRPYLQSPNEGYKLSCLATLADIINENESEMLQTNTDVVNFLMNRYKKALEDPQKRCLGWSTWEIGRTIRQLARNDANKKMLVELGALPLLVKMAQTGNDDEIAEAVSAIWVLAFDTENQKKIVESVDPDVVDLLTSLRSSSDTKVRKACNGALWTLRTALQESEKYKDLGKSIDKSSDRVSSIRAGRSGADEGHIMVSYQWGSQKTLLRISSKLKAQGYNVWMDVDQMGGSTLQAMAEAVENASVVLVCYSHKYKDSPNCRAEAEYAFQKRKKIIPLLMERGYKPDGWLGFIVGAKLFYEFTDKYPFEVKYEGLLKELKNAFGQPDAIVPQKAAPVASARDEVDAVPVYSGADDDDRYHHVAATNVVHVAAIKKWSDNDVEKWINKYNLSKEKFGSLSGLEIALLISMRKEAPQFFYQSLKEMLYITDLRTMAIFVDALENVHTV